MGVSLTVYAKDIGGYTPAIDPRRLDKPAIISGRNFLFDVDGPRSAFALGFANWAQFDTITRLKFIDFHAKDGNIYYGTPTGVWRMNAISELPELIFYHTTPNTYWPWSFAQINNLIYWAQYDIGLYEYDISTETITKLAVPPNEFVRGVCASYGRLAIISDQAYFWSGFEDARVWNDPLATGAAAQAASLVGGTPLRVDNVSDGFIVTTTEGLVKAEFVQAAYVFRHTVLSTEIKAFSPNAGLNIPDVGYLVIDPNGMYLTNGGKPQVWEPLHSEFLRTTYLHRMDRTKIGCLQLSFINSRQMICISVAPNAREGLFPISFVYYVPAAKWGVCNRPHHAIFDIVQFPERVERAGLMGPDGFMYLVDEIQNYSEAGPTAPDAVGDFIWRLGDDRVVYTSEGLTIGTNELLFTDGPPFIVTVPSGMYRINDNVLSDTVIATTGDPEWLDNIYVPVENINISVGATNMDFFASGAVELIPVGYIPPENGLLASITVAPFRFAEQAQADETSMISTMIIGVAHASASDQREDWNDDDGEEDWNAEETRYEDWGEGNFPRNVFDTYLIATNDAVNPIPGKNPEHAQIIQNYGSSFQYGTEGWSGIFHLVRLDALDPGESFALKHIDIAGMLTGRSL